MIAGLAECILDIRASSKNDVPTYEAAMKDRKK